MNRILLLHNIRSVYNVGAIFRTADAVGIDQIIISGFTPAPIDRFGRKRSDLHKAAVGAEEFVGWQQITDPVIFLEQQKKEGVKIVSIEQSKNSVDYKTIDCSQMQSVVFVLGSETDGVDQELLDLSDYIAEIPMKGEKESLNVSVAAGVALFGLLRV